VARALNAIIDLSIIDTATAKAKRAAVAAGAALDAATAADDAARARLDALAWVPAMTDDAVALEGAENDLEALVTTADAVGLLVDDVNGANVAAARLGAMADDARSVTDAARVATRANVAADDLAAHITTARTWAGRIVPAPTADEIQTLYDLAAADADAYTAVQRLEDDMKTVILTSGDSLAAGLSARAAADALPQRCPTCGR
jgi:hypothetical protein